MHLRSRAFPIPHLIAIAAIFAGFKVCASAEEKHPFRMTLESEMEMVIGGKKTAITAHTEFDYTWQKSGRTRALVADRLSSRTNSDGKVDMHMVLTRDKFTMPRNAKITEVPFDDLPAEMQAGMKQSFGVPLMKSEVNADGAELSRTVTAGPAVEEILGPGYLANGSLFHPSKPAGRDDWQAEREMSMGSAGSVKGKLTYKKIENRPEAVYAVTGTLTNDHARPPENPVSMKDVRYVVNGEQTYDATQKEWVSGNLKIDVNYTMAAEGKTIGTAKGSMVATMKTRK